MFLSAVLAGTQIAAVRLDQVVHGVHVLIALTAAVKRLGTVLTLVRAVVLVQRLDVAVEVSDVGQRRAADAADVLAGAAGARRGRGGGGGDGGRDDGRRGRGRGRDRGRGGRVRRLRGRGDEQVIHVERRRAGVRRVLWCGQRGGVLRQKRVLFVVVGVQLRRVVLCVHLMTFPAVNVIHYVAKVRKVDAAVGAVRRRG